LVVDFFLDRVGDVVEEGDDGVGGLGGGGVEEVAADARGVELEDASIVFFLMARYCSRGSWLL
jgi:hypothetical protein